MPRKKNWQFLFILLIFFLLPVSGHVQENQSLFPEHMKNALMALYNTNNTRIDKLKEELMAAYRSQGETVVRNLVKEKREEITLPLIVEIVDSGFKEKNEQWLRISMILIEEKKNHNAPGTSNTTISTNNSEDILYDTLYILAQMGICMGLPSHESAYECLENLITQVEKINHPQAQEVLVILKMSINAMKKDFNKMEKVFDDEIVFIKDKGNPQHQGNMHLAKGALYMNSGDYINACDMFEKALSLYEKAGDMKGQGNVYMLWGGLYGNIRDEKRACAMLDKALPFLEKAGAFREQCTIYRMKANIYEDIGEYLKTVEMYDKALGCLEKTKNRPETAEIYLAKGHVYQRAGNRLKAREMYNQALAILGNEMNAVDRKILYEMMGAIDLRNGEWSHAIEMYERAVPLHTDFGHFEGKGHLYKTLGVIHYLASNYSTAATMYDQALREYQKTGTNEWLSHTLHCKAQALEKLGQKAEALSLFEEAIEKLEKIRRQTAFSWMKMAQMKKLYDQYEETAVVMLENKYYEKGFKCIDSMKARVFLDQLAEGLVKPDKGITPELLQKRDSLVNKLSLLSKEIGQTDQKEDTGKLKKLKDKYRETETEFENLLVKIRLENPLYASVQYPEMIPLDNLQKNILKANEVLIQYFITAEKVYVFLVSKKEFKVVPLEIKEKDIEKMAADFLQPFNRDGTKSRITIPMIARWLNRYGHVLYRSVFKPIERALDGKTDIIIVPDGELAKIPFESFVIDDTNMGKSVYLLEKYRIKYIQSASALSFLRKYHQKERETNHFIGFGDPVYDYENFKEGKPERGNSVIRVGPCTPVAKNSTLTPGSENRYGNEIKEIHRGKYDREGGAFNRLPGSGQEVETIAVLFKNKNQKNVVYLREQANEENAKAADMKEFDYIHFSCHGILGENFQSLVLSQIPNSKEDGYLTLNEIMNCDYNAKLVVLSACETGTGKMERAEGVTGLTRAVMYAGTPAVVASLWNVSDVGTKELMVKFYPNILEKAMSKEEALRQAKLEMIRGGKYLSPYYWSAFVMYGE